MEFKGLILSEDNDIFVSVINEDNCLEYIETGVNFKSIFNESIKLALESYSKTPYDEQEIPEVSEALLILPYKETIWTEKLLEDFSVVLRAFLLNAKLIDIEGELYPILNFELFEIFIKTQLEAVLIGYLYEYYSQNLIGFYAVRCRKKIICNFGKEDIALASLNDMLKIDVVISCKGKETSISLPATSEKLDNAIQSICKNKSDKYTIRSISSNCIIMPAKDEDIVQYNEYLKVLDMCATPKEVTKIYKKYRCSIDKLVDIFEQRRKEI